MELFGRAIAVNPKVGKCHANLGAVLLEMGRFDESIESFRKALLLSPDAIDAAVGLGNALCGRPDGRKKPKGRISGRWRSLARMPIRATCWALC